MEIKKRLQAVAKRLGNEVEAMNMAYELRDICGRLEELADYHDAKLEQEKAREKRGEGRLAEQQRKNREAQIRIEKMHEEEAEEMMRDQQQHKANPDIPEEFPDTVDNGDTKDAG